MGERLTKEEHCPYFHDHTPSPAGYIQWHPWAAAKSKTHEQVKCSGCGLYVIWIPRRSALSQERQG